MQDRARDIELAARLGVPVTGIDFTTRLIRLAQQIKEQGLIRFVRNEEGEIQSYRELHLADFGLSDAAGNVEFWQGDVSNLPEKFAGYGLVIAENAVGGAIDPRRFLNNIHSRMNPSGILAVADAFDYDPEVTLSENRVGGFRKDGEPFSSSEGLREILLPRFEPVSELPGIWQTLPLDANKFKLRLVHVSVWRLRG